MQSRGSSIAQRGPVWDWARRPAEGRRFRFRRPAIVDDVILPACFLALVGLLLLGGLLTLLGRVSAGLPAATSATCASIEACAAPVPADDLRTAIGGVPVAGPTETP